MGATMGTKFDNRTKFDIALKIDNRAHIERLSLEFGNEFISVTLG